MEKEIYILVGLPGSGKTTWIERIKKDNDIHISRDNIRFSMLKEGEDYFSKEKEVLRKFYHTIKKSINDNKIERIYVDATHLNKKSRKRVLELAAKGENIKIIGVYFELPLDVCLSRNANRVGRAFVPEEVIKDMKKRLTCPVKEEGFDEIVTISEKGEKVLK